MSYNTFNEAFQDFQTICKRNVAQGYVGKTLSDPALEPRQVAILNKVLDKLKSTKNLGPYSFDYEGYDRDYHKASFRITMSKDRNNGGYGASRSLDFRINQLADFFSNIPAVINNIESYCLPSFGRGDFSLEGISKYKNILTTIENSITAAISDTNKLRKDVALEAFMFSKTPGRMKERQLAWSKRWDTLRNLQREMKSLWLDEHPLKEGDPIMYRYVYNGYEHGERKEGTIVSIDNYRVKIRTSKNRIIEKTRDDIFRTDTSKYEGSPEYEAVSKCLRGEITELAA